jgi:ribosomal protein S17E
MDTAEIKRRRAELEEYYKKLYDQDAEVIKEEAMQYAGNDVQRAKDYIAGYMSSIKQPHTRMIRLITMYVMDFVPYFKKHPDSKNMVTRIREIFRQKRYPEKLFDPKDPSKSVNDEVCKNKCSETSGTTEE